MHVIYHIIVYIKNNLNIQSKTKVNKGIILGFLINERVYNWNRLGSIIGRYQDTIDIEEKSY